jgi:hypothetical protein
MKKLNNNKIAIGVIIILLLIFSSIILFVDIFNINIQLSVKIFGILLLSFFSYFLYKEKQWARWLFVYSFFVSGIGSVVVLFKFNNLIFPFHHIMLVLISLFYLSSAIYLAFIRKYKK